MEEVGNCKKINDIFKDHLISLEKIAILPDEIDEAEKALYLEPGLMSISQFKQMK